MSQRTASALITLNGDWDLCVHGQLQDRIRVPSSQRPRGFYRLERSFLMPRLSAQQRAILHFDAITYYARVFVNGHELGSLAPYVPHEFDFAPQTKEGSNTIAVDIADACPGPGEFGKDALAFGVTTGWETYGGIVRDVWAELRPSTFINNVRFAYRLSSDYGMASCSPQVLVDSNVAQPCECELKLFFGQTEVAHALTSTQLKAGITEVPLRFEVRAPALWSPEEPNLYELRAVVKTSSGEHYWHCNTGFRNLVIRGTNFELNSEPLTLRGICRMELWKDQGFSMSLEQRERDMRGIKQMGANFVRLQPFPHDRGIIDLADRLGLLVSEEPGYWWADFRKCPRSFIDLGLDVLEKNIRRDWNSPSVMCWFLGNESYFTASYLKEAKALCNRLDPIRRPVSIAHENAEPQEAKKLFDDSGMDFYDWHAYGFSKDKFEELPTVFGSGKPITFSEWGWEVVGKGVFYERYFDKLMDQVEAGRVGGYMFFDWNDYPQFTRTDWATGKDGILHSGVVDEGRQIREPIYSRLRGLFGGRHEFQTPAVNDRPTVLPLRFVPFTRDTRLDAFDLQGLIDSATQRQAWARLETDLEKFWGRSHNARDQWVRSGEHLHFWKSAEVEIAGGMFRSATVDGRVRPLLMAPNQAEVVIPIRRNCRGLHILGQVTLPDGYPARGGFGEAVGQYTLEYRDGQKTVLAIRNGLEVAQANRIVGATRTTPVATRAQPALEFIKDPAREQYQILLWSIPLDQKELATIRCRATAGDSYLAIFAITTEAAEPNLL